MRICSSKVLPILLSLAVCRDHGYKCNAFVPSVSTSATTTTTSRWHVSWAKQEDQDDEEEDDVISLRDGADWRAFRAKLVMSESKSPTTEPSPSTTSSGSALDGDLDGIGSLFSDDFVLDASTSSGSSTDEVSESSTVDNPSSMESGMTPLDPSQWAYDSGDVIEQGAVILGGVEQEFGFGLRQQYFHKAAILVLDHDEHTFTKGIILNRPTDLMLQDDVNKGKEWRVWFGGDVEGLNAQHPDIVCLHSLRNKKATEASIPIMKDIQWTTFHNAKKLVQSGVAEVRDFWVFVGYAGWGASQLKGELERNSWYMVATDSQTLLKELARQGEGADPRDAGLETWDLLMRMIGRQETAQEHSGDFDDWMLKEWAFSHLLSNAGGGGGGRQQRDPRDFNTNPELVETLLSRMLGGDKDDSDQPKLEGTLLRASSQDRSPFLLDSQELHKSIVLVLADEDAASVGVVLNRPSAKGLDIKVADKGTGGSKIVTLPMRFGGQYSVSGQEPLLWLHNSPSLRQRQIGSPVGKSQASGIWKCTAQDVVNAVSQALATPEEFLVVSGVSVWEKNAQGTKNGIDGEMELGNFESISSSTRDEVWDQLLVQQEVLTRNNIDKNLAMAEIAWQAGDSNGKISSDSRRRKFSLPIRGLGEGFDEDDDSFVFKTDVKVSKLSDEALRSWCATFLLGQPSLEL